MKKLITAISLVALVVGVFCVAYLVEKPANAYVSTRMYSAGVQDRETIWVTAGDTLQEGDVVSWEQDYNAYTIELADTYAVVVRSNTENDSNVAGITLSSAVPKQSVQLVIRGEVSCRIDGSDSGGSIMVYGTILSTAGRQGRLGAAHSDSVVVGTAVVSFNGSLQTERYFRTMPVGKLIAASVAVTDTGAITTFRCYVDVRSGF